MISNNAQFGVLKDSLLHSGNAVNVAYVHNYLFEERMSIDRQVSYETHFVPPEAVLKGWKESHKRYLWNRVFVTAQQWPETFSDINRDAMLIGLDENQYIVRVENLHEALDSQNIALTTLITQLDIWRDTLGDQEAKQDAVGFLTQFCEHWNLSVRRQNRPAFAAFFDELDDEIQAPDWPHRVRNRLGLSHYDGLSNPIPVALMRYRVKEVLDGLGEEQKKRAFAVPTVLDGELNAHFFPTPHSAQYGRTLQLEPDSDCDKLVSEILHRRIDYTSEHIYKVGLITDSIPPFVRGANFARLRNEHLFCLRYETGIEDFGEDIPENDHD